MKPWIRFSRSSWDRETERLKERIASAPRGSQERFDRENELYLRERVAQEEEDDDFTRRLLTEACRLRVPRPEFPKEERGENEWWVFSHVAGRYILRERGIHEIRNAIRNEQAARRNAWLAWVPVVTALTGLLGVTVGVLSLLRR